MTPDLLADAQLVQRIPVVPTILSICGEVAGMRLVAVARVTADAYVVAAVQDDAGFGLRFCDELDVKVTVCDRIRHTLRSVVIEQASTDPDWCAHPTPRSLGYESFIGAPIVLGDGTFWGTLFAIDPDPQPLRSKPARGTFDLMARLLALQIDAELRVEASRTEAERAHGEVALRERFVAVLGHDLRNPLAAIGAGVTMLRREAPSARAAAILDLVEGSADRMTGLVDETLDLARGRLGGGIPVDPVAGVDLGPLLAQIVEELRSVHPGRVIEAAIPPLPRLRCDARRIGQLASNLLGNALAHGAAEVPIRLAADAGDGIFRLAVENGGAPIPADVLADLFAPFRRGGGGGTDGLGLGLYIAAEIARAHGGRIEATSEPGLIRFAFTMPVLTGPVLTKPAG